VLHKYNVGLSRAYRKRFGGNGCTSVRRVG
jgi:hypothetical protein